MDRLTDADLLARAHVDADAFGEIYRRHEALVLGFLARRTRDPELAADLAAETFATALLKAKQFRGEASAAPWLLGIGRNLMLESLRRGRIEERARRRLGVEPIAVSDASLERVEALADEGLLLAALETLPEGQREAVRAYVLDETPYDDLAHKLGVGSATVRQRVSRGLAQMRATLEDNGT